MFRSISNIHRELSGASASNSVPSGNGVTTFAAGTPAVITVTAKNSGGGTISSGGDIFAVKISNPCSIIDTYYCDPGSGPLSSSINGVMTDHNNGTYTYTYTVGSTGETLCSYWHM